MSSTVIENTLPYSSQLLKPARDLETRLVRPKSISSGHHVQVGLSVVLLAASGVGDRSSLSITHYRLMIKHEETRDVSKSQIQPDMINSVPDV